MDDPYVRISFLQPQSILTLACTTASSPILNSDIFLRTSMPLLFIFLPIVYALTFKVVHTNVQTLLDVRLVGTLRTCEVPGSKIKQLTYLSGYYRAF